MKRGYFGIGIYMPKTEINVGTLFRSAFQFGADFIFTIGHRYHKQSSDTTKTFRHIPLFQYETYDTFKNTLFDCQTICVEFTDSAISLVNFVHPERCVYLLGAEDFGIPPDIIGTKKTIQIPSVRTQSYNVAVAGSIIMYDRYIKRLHDGQGVLI